MKTLISKSIMASLFVALFSLAITGAALANDEKKAVKTELYFVGKIKNQPVFKLNLDNADEQEFTIFIRDESNSVLYRHSSKEAVFTKKFLLMTDEIGANNLRFEIVIGKSDAKPIVYEVYRSSRYVDEMVISKLN